MSDAPNRSLGLIETDTPCESCGFNLHGQRIWRDERLGLPLCRCPECGRHHAAGVRTSATVPWLNRLGLLGLLAWLAIGVAFVLASVGLCVMIQMAASEVGAHRGFETTDGRSVYTTYNGTRPDRPGPLWALAPVADERGQVTSEESRLVPKEQVVFRIRPSGLFRPPPGMDHTAWRYLRVEDWIEMGLAVTFAIACVALVGAIAASAFWFWRPRRRLAWLGVPVLAALIWLGVEWANLGWSRGVRLGRESDMPILGTGWIVAAVAIVAALQMLFLAIGLWLGRPFVRRLILIFIPPKARQAFAFLWLCDGKTMPMEYFPPRHT